MNKLYFIAEIGQNHQGAILAKIRKFQPSGYTLNDLKEIRDYYRQKLKEIKA